MYPLRPDRVENMIEFAEMVAGINPPPRTRAMMALLVNSSESSAVTMLEGSTMCLVDNEGVVDVVLVVGAKKASPTTIMDRNKRDLDGTIMVQL
mmetsp:Transcript_19626/g.45670  ORF Transcript_19626/g.45670 Transcript_19626/m.45670 type:complete len:94 (+) Transcript_19626:860-1141(+)